MGLELKSYGLGTAQVAVGGTPTVQAAGQRLTYQWDTTVQEWWVNDQRGLEHGYTVARRPEVREVLDCGSPLPLSEADAPSAAQRTSDGERGGEKRQRAGAVQDAGATSQPLAFLLAVRGGLTPKISADTKGVLFLDAAGATVVNYTGLKVWDADGKVLTSHFELVAGRARLSQRADDETTDNDYTSRRAEDSAPYLRLLVDERGARYPLTIDPIAQQAYLKASNTGADDNFGTSVAISGDTVVVGAYHEDSGTTGVNSTPNENTTASGAAYVFVRSGTAWTQQAYLKASQASVLDRFGYSVAVSGDTIVVGAILEDSSTTGVNSTPNESATDAGAAYVFVRSGTTWSQQAYLKASQVTAGDNFGISVAVSGDTVVVGANNEWSSTTGVNSTPNEDAPGAGAAYVFVRSGTTWTQQAYLKASQVFSSGDEFGRSVAVSGDTVVVGAFREDSSTTGVNSTPNESATDAGAAYVFVRNGTTWTQQAYLKPSHVTAGDFFGWAVAVAGDTVVVGAREEDSSTTGVNSTPNKSAATSGAAFVFVRSGTTWTQQAYLKASQVSASDYFGYSVAVAGDTIVVGAIWESSSTTGVNSTPNESFSRAGAAYVFARSGTTWTQQAYLKASTVKAGDEFGTSVAVSGDTVIVGAYFEDSSSTRVNSTPNESAAEAGAAYIFTGLGLPEIAITGNSVSIADGDSTPTTADHTDFGNVAVAGSTLVRTFTIANSGGANLTLSGTPKVVVSGTHAADFTVTALPTSPVAASGSTTFQVTFNPSATGTRSATLTIANDDADEGTFDFAIQGTGTAPEINVTGNGVSIPDGDGTPSSADHTDFGSQRASSGTVVRTFTIQNLGTDALSLTGTPKVTVSSGHASDFTVTALPSSPVAASGSTTFQVTFDPSATGTRFTTVSISNDDSDEATYDFTIQGTGVEPEINVSGNGNSIADGDATPASADHTDFGNVLAAGSTLVRTFSIQNLGTESLSLSGTPRVAVSGTHAADFTVTTLPSSSVATSASTTFQVTFDPSAIGLRTATLTIANDDANEGTYDFAIQGTGANSSPTDISLSSARVQDAAAVNTTIGTFTATDADVGDTHTFTLVAGTGDTHNSKFSIASGNTLKVAVAPVLADSSYSIRVRATDALGATYEEAMTVLVMAVVVDAGDYLIADRGPYRNTGVILVVTRTGAVQRIISTQLKDPYDIVVDSAGDFIVADYDYDPTGFGAGRGSGLFKIHRQTGVTTRLVFGAPLVTPLGVKVESDGKLLVADSDYGYSSGNAATVSAGAVIRINANGTSPTVLASGGNFFFLQGLALAPNGDIYVANFANGNANFPTRIVKVDKTTGTQTTITTGGLTRPMGLAVEADGNSLVVVDVTAKKLIRVALPAGTQTEVSADTQFIQPTHVTIEADGNYLVTDGKSSVTAGERRIYRVNRTTGVATVLVSDGFFQQPRGVTLAQ